MRKAAYATGLWFGAMTGIAGAPACGPMQGSAFARWDPFLGARVGLRRWRFFRSGALELAMSASFSANAAIKILDLHPARFTRSWDTGDIVDYLKHGRR